MAKLKRDDELFKLLTEEVFSYYDLEPGDGSNDDLIENKMTGYSELQKKARDAVAHYKTMFEGEKNPEKALRKYLVDLKEKAMQEDINLIYSSIDEIPTLKNRILEIVEQGMDPDIRDSLDRPEISVKDIFDESLFHERTDRWITGKDGKEYLRAVSMETRRNELIRQLSDLPYPELPGKVEELREQYVQISGKKYNIPATTYKREYVTLRQKIGKLVAEKGGIIDSVKRLDPAYDYRRIADKVGKLQNGNLSKEQKEFLDQQVRYLEGDVAILSSYKELAEQLKPEVKPPSDKLSVKDQILQYRKQLGDRLQEISGNVDISKKSLAYLDLVESRKGDNPQLYQETVADLAEEPGIGKYRAKRWSSGERTVPLTAWKSRASDIIKKQEERRQFLFSDNTTFEDFQEAWKDPKNRSAVAWKEETDADGKVTKRYLDRLVSFGGNRYRAEIDDQRLAEDFARTVGEAPSIAEAAKQRILTVKQGQIDQLAADIVAARTAGKDVSRLEDALEKKRNQLAKLKNSDYSYSHIGSLDIRAAKVREAADRLSVKADILELDPAFQFHKVSGDLSGIRQELLLTTKPAVEGFQWRFKREGLTAPDRVSRLSLDDQLSWYRTAETLMDDISTKSYDEFKAAVDAIGFKNLNRNLPVGYLRRIKGSVYRSTVDSDVISSYDNVAQRYREREQRAMTGPSAKAQSSVGQNKFGALLQQNMVADQKIVQDAQAAFNSTSDLFSSSYGNLSAAAKQFYDRNYGVPVKEGNNYYRSIYDMPDDAWTRAEKAAGYDTPRQRSGIISSDINAAEEEKLQQEVTADLKGRTWEPVKKEDKAAAAVAQEKKLDEIVVSARAEQETKNNLRRMLQRAEKEVKRGGIGSMGLMGAFVLFNAAMTGTSREAEERRRRVEQERRIKKYGYDYQ